MMSQNIGMKATGQRVSVAVFMTKKICNLLCSVFIKQLCNPHRGLTVGSFALRLV